MKKIILPVLALALTLSACSTPAPPAALVAQTPTVTVPAAKPTAVVDVPVKSASLSAMAPTVPPTSVTIDAVSIDVPVVPVGILDDGTMEIPEDPAIAGWYKFGKSPNSPDGNTVISAHIDSPEYPIGPFASLRDVPAGADVLVGSQDGTTTRYTVESITYYPKAELPTDLLFARSGQRDLVLITCGGAFNSDTGHYDDNVVLVAKPVA